MYRECIGEKIIIIAMVPLENEASSLNYSNNGM